MYPLNDCALYPLNDLTKENLMKTFYFNTGVRPQNRSVLCKGQIWRNGTMQIPFDVPDDVPSNATLLGLSNHLDSFGYGNAKGYIIRVEVSNTSMVSKYAFFRVTNPEFKIH